MTTKQAHDHDVLPSTTTPTFGECCMCGDYGLSQELFQCKTCLSRFQHRYCSNLYPKPGPYSACNWCLKKQGEKLKRSQSSLPFTYRSNTDQAEEDTKKKIKKNSSSNSSHVKKEACAISRLHATSTIKKPGVNSDSIIGRKKVVCGQEKSLRRTKSEGIVNSRMIKQAFRGKVQRYKLLQEVCIQ